MIPFKALNEKYYSKVIPGYTSNDEFTFNKRIWENNELPAIDLYDMAHSMLRDDLWGWLLGSTSMAYDINFNYETNAEEYFDNDNIITHATIAKYVNNVRTKNYGPLPYYKYEKDEESLKGGMQNDERPFSLKDDLSGPSLTYTPNSWVYRPVWPSYTRYEINGTITPECDFLLHEGYRYLKSAYPDHPEYDVLLTTNEINDEYNQISTFIDFRINCPFYDWLATQLNYSEEINEGALYSYYRKEALKLKYRNLTKHAFRRKLFGSKAGYWMFGSEALQHTTIYPVAQYIPLKPRSYIEIEEDENITNNYYNINKNNNYKWFRKLFKAPELFREKVINYEDTFYTHPFRLIDFSNSSYNLKNRYQPPLKIFGTAYPSPLSPYDLYEYPAERDEYIPLTMQDDFYEGQKVFIGERNLDQDLKIPAYINAMFYENLYRVNMYLEYTETGIFNQQESEVNTKIFPESISRIQVNAPIFPIYTKFKIHDSIKKSIIESIEKNLDLTEYKKKDLLLDQIKEIRKLIPDRENEVDIAIDVHQEGNIFLPAQQFLSLYKDNLNIKINRDNSDPIIEYFGTGLNNIDGFIREADLLIKDDHSSTNPWVYDPTGNKYFVSEICGLEGGKLTIQIDKPYLITQSTYNTLVSTNYSEARYGLVLQFSKNNVDSFNKKVIIFGKPEFVFLGPDYNNNYHIDKIIFTISAIPRIKSVNQLRLLYSGFENIAIQKVDNLFIILGNGSNLNIDNFFKKYYIDEIKEIVDNYIGFKTTINLLSSKFRVQNETKVILDTVLNKYSKLFNYSNYTDPEEKYTNLLTYLSNYEDKIIKQLVINPNKTTFDLINNDLKATLEDYQNKFYNDLIKYRFPINDTVENIESKISIIKPQVQNIWDIIQTIENGIGLHSILEKDYNEFYEFFEEFTNYFEYSSGSNGLQSKVKNLINNFKIYADNLLFSIEIQPTIYNIYNLIENIKKEVLDHIIIIDQGGLAPYPILTGKNFTELRKEVKIYKDFYQSKENYSDIVNIIDRYLYEIDNVIIVTNHENFNKEADKFYNKIKEFRNPYIIEPVEYNFYLDSFLVEIKKYQDIFHKDLVDMPVLIEGYPVRFPIQSIINEFKTALNNFSEAFNDEFNTWNTAIDFGNKILEDHFKYENDIRVFHFEDYKDYIEILKPALDIYYQSFQKVSSTKSINNETFKNDATLIINTFNTFINFYQNELKCMIACDLNREYYLFDDNTIQNFTSEQKRAVLSIQSIDSTLDNYMPNRGLLLKPLPEDIYLSNYSRENFSYSFLNYQDLYLGIIKFKFDVYNNFIDFEFIKEFANSGIMTDYYPGAVNTAQIIHNDLETKPSDEQFRPQEKYIKNHTITELDSSGKPITEEYLSLNEDILELNSLTNNQRKFSYCHSEWLELFLPESYKFNIEGEVPKRYEVQIRSILERNSTLIQFIDEESKKRINALTTGDPIIGPNIENDTFIEAIDLFNNTIITNKPMNFTGDIVLTYCTLYNLYPEEFNSNNFFDYRVDLSHSGKRERKHEPELVDNGSILEHGVVGSEYYPNISQNFVYGYIDIIKYKEDLLQNLKKYSSYKENFNKIVRNTHNDNKELLNEYTQPSFINYTGDAYFEVNAHRLYENNEFIMTKEILDYFQDYMYELSRASDKVNIGVNILATTDTTGRVSTIFGQKYSDPNINLRFVTTKAWSDFNIPAYIELGIGCLENLFISEDKAENQKREEQHKSYYNWDVYDNRNGLPLKKLRDQGIHLDNETGAMWSHQTIGSNLDNPIDYIHHVDIPVFTYKLGEYEVQKNIQFENYTNPEKKFTTVQFSIIKQYFSDIEVKGEPLKQITKDFLSFKIFTRFSEGFFVTQIDNNSIPYNLFDSNKDIKNITYRGEWIPNTIAVDNRNTINYPEAENNTINLFYYYITKSASLSSAYDIQENNIVDKNYNFGTILLWNNKWEEREFSFAGLLGNISQSDMINPSAPEDLREMGIIQPPINPRGSNTLKKCLIGKLLNHSGILAEIISDELDILSCEDLTKIFDKLCGKTVDLTTIPLDIFEKLENNYNLLDKENLKEKYKESSIYWFYVINLKHDTPFQDALKDLRGDPLVFGLIYFDNNFYIYQINHTRGFYLIDHSNKLGIQDREYGIFTGLYGFTKKDLLPFERIQKYQNTLSLAFDNIIPGSINFNWKLKPHFEVKGYPYIDEDTIDYNLSVPNNYDITEDNIYFDQLNNTLYSFNNNKNDKFSIIQENNKYFKNVLFLYCNYNTELVTSGQEVIERAKLTGIPTIPFESNLVSLKDRILSIEQINIRSKYDINLETTQFSNYLQMTGIIKGIYIENPEDINSPKYLSIGYRKASEPKNSGNRLKYAAELNKILPLKFNPETEETTEWTYNDIEFDNLKKAYWGDRSFITTPIIQSSEVYKDLALDSDVTVFKYYKNTLILEGKIMTDNPGYIDFSDNPLRKNALTKITNGNPIVSIVGLNPLAEKSYILFKVFKINQSTGNIEPSDINITVLDYNNGYLIGADEKQYFIYPCSDLSKLGTWVPGDPGYYQINALHYSYDKVIGAPNRLISLSYEIDNRKWIFAFSRENSESSDLYSLEVYAESDGTLYQDFTFTYDKAGYDINTYQRIRILDENYGDTRYNTSETVFARDITFERNTIIEPFIETIIPDIEGIPSAIGLPTNDIFINGQTRKNGRLFNTANRFNLATVSLLTANEAVDYRTITFILTKNSNSVSNISIGIVPSDFSNSEVVQSIWTYNYNTDMWEKSSNMSAFFNFITSFDAPNQSIPVTAYIVHDKFLYENDESKFKLRDLPAPPSLNTIAIVLGKTINNINNNQPGTYTVTIRATTEGTNPSFTIHDFKVTTPKRIINNPDNEKDSFTHSNYIESPYFPLLNDSSTEPFLNKYDQFYSNRWSAYYGNYQLIVIGNTLFLKSPTRIAIKENSDPRGSIYGSGFTSVYHWKRAQLPSVSDITYQLFKEMDLIGAYNFVKNQYDQIKIYLSGISTSNLTTNEQTAINNLKGWITDNPPEKFLTDEELPVSIMLKGVRFYHTEAGQVPYFLKSGAQWDNNYYQEWQSTIDSKFELGDVHDVFLKKQNYLRYLADYYYVILGTRRFDFFFSPDGIKDVILTNNNLVIQTKYNDIVSLNKQYFGSRQEIENYHNWEITNIDEEYVYGSDKNTLNRIIGVRDTTEGVDTFVQLNIIPVSYPEKTFKLLNKYIEGNISIFCGYIQLNSTVRAAYNSHNTDSEEDTAFRESILNLFPNNSSISNNVNLFDIKYPVIYYSTDFKNYTKALLPAEDFITNISSFTGTEKSHEAFSIVREGTRINVYFRQVTDNIIENSQVKGFTSFLTTVQGDTSVLQYEYNVESYENSPLRDTIIKEAKNGFLNSQNMMLLGSIDSNSTEFSNTGNRFMINDQYRPDLGNSTVIQIEEQALHYSPAPPASSVGELLRVLVSIDSTYMIPDQLEYVAFKEEYFDTSRGIFKVPEFIEVGDIYNANRMYSPRECLPIRIPGDTSNKPAPRELLPKTGMPSVSEDNIDGARLVYEYDIVINRNGEEEYHYRNAKNKNDDYIYLCNDKGDYLLQIDITSLQQIISLRQMLEADMSIEGLARAPIVRSDYSAVQKDVELTDLMNKVFTQKNIKYISFPGSNPLLYINMPVKFNEFIFYLEGKDSTGNYIKNSTHLLPSINELQLISVNEPLKERIDEYNKYRLLYLWPTKGNSDASLSDLNNLYYDITSLSTYIIPNNQYVWDFIQARASIEEYEGFFEPHTGNQTPFNGRFKPYQINGRWYIMDSFTNTLMLKEQSTITNNYNIPYLFQNGIEIFSNRGFQINRLDNPFVLESPNQRFPITGMYIPHGGYGGYMGNTSWLERFDQIDSKAWNHDKFLKNSFDEYIYLCDYRGNKLQIKQGLFFNELGENIEVTYNNLTQEGQNIFTVSEDLISDKFEYNIYKITPSKPEIYSPKNTVWFNRRIDSDIPTPINTENRLALIKIIKSGITISDLNAEGITYKILDIRAGDSGFDKDLLPTLRQFNTNDSIPIDFSFYEFYLKEESLSGKPQLYLYYKFNNQIAEIPYIDYNAIKLRITDKFNQEAEFIFNIADKLETEYGRILGIDEVYLFEETYIGNTFVNIIFDGSSLTNEDTNNELYLKTEDLTIIPNEVIITQQLLTPNENVIASFSINTILNSKQVFYYGIYGFNFDIRNLNLKFYTQRNWVKDTSNINEIRPKLYSGDREINNNSISRIENLIEYSFDENRSLIIARLDTVLLYQPYKINNFISIGNMQNIIENINYIFLKDTNPIIYTFNSRLLVDGLYGSVLIKVPEYESFKDLLDKLEYIIEYKNRRIINQLDSTKKEFNRFLDIAKNNSYVILENLINYNFTGNNFLKIRILPTNTIYPALKTANNPDYICEINQTEIDSFGLDRIWINDRAYPLPPIMKNNIVYNQNSKSLYYENLWKNRDNYSIYCSDETGRFIKFIPSGTKLITEIIGDSRGDLRKEIFGNIDPRHNLVEPIYKSSLDWFLSEFYIKGKESNPFITQLTLTEDVKNKEYNQIMLITQQKKQNGIFIDKEIKDSYVSQVLKNILYKPSNDNLLLLQDTEIDFMDYRKGIINFSMIEPIFNYRNNENLILYGINYYNTYWDKTGPLKPVWSSVVDITNMINMTFDINSFENYLDKKNKDLAVIAYTEMGIFDGQGRLIAYMHHPKVEYRTDSQHISYTAIISEPE